MRRLAAALLLSGLLVLPTTVADAARSCKPKKEAKGCVVTNAEWGEANSFKRSANIIVSRSGIDEIITMLPGSPSGNYPSAPRRCGVVMSTRSAVLFGSGPQIKGPIRIGGTYSGNSKRKIERGQPGFRDPGAAFGGNAVVQSFEASYRLTVKVLSAKRVRVTASGTETVQVMYRDPSAQPDEPSVPGTFTCKASYSGNVARGRY